MNKIISIHLNGKAYQLEEEGYEALRQYLAHADKQLKDNPDKTEIISDLEQAIADKCNNFLSSTKDIVTSQEIAAILQEMGPVEGSASASDSTQAGESKDVPRAPKRLYLIREGAVFAGVCTGLAAYFDVDVTLVRMAFIILTILTGGGWVLLYLAMMFFLPYANTSEERARAHGDVFNAQEVIDRAKESYARFTGREEWKSWKREFSREKTKAKEFRRYPQTQRSSPILGIISVLIGVLWIVALISLIVSGAKVVTAFVPLWVAIVVLFLVYRIVMGPFRAARWVRADREWRSYEPLYAMSDALGTIIIILCLWFAYDRIPEFHAFVNEIPQHIRNAIEILKAQ